MLKLVTLNKLGPFKLQPVPCYALKAKKRLDLVLRESSLEKDIVYSEAKTELKQWGGH
jgi:hypothetical protein